MAYNEYWADCVLALRFDDPSIVDSRAAHSITNTDVTLSATVSDSGGESGSFNGTTSYLQIVQGSPTIGYLPDPDEFTIAFSFYSGDLKNYNYIMYVAEDFYIRLVYGSIEVKHRGTETALVAIGISENTLHKVMVVRDNTPVDDLLKIFIDGIEIASTVIWNDVGNGSSDIYIGANRSLSSTAFFSGYLDELYVVHGIALEREDYTPVALFDDVIATANGSGLFSFSGEMVALVDVLSDGLGEFSFSGEADVTHIRPATADGYGGIALSGSAASVTPFVAFVSGTFYLSGAAEASHPATAFGSGKLNIGGGAQAFIPVNGFASGNLAFAGTCSAMRGESASALGAVSLGGGAVASLGRSANGSGAFYLSGSATAKHGRSAYAEGGILLSGGSSASFLAPYIGNGLGEFSLSGGAQAEFNRIMPAFLQYDSVSVLTVRKEVFCNG